MKDKLIIPDTLHVGFQKRYGTYTGQLAYVVYEDHAGVIKKKGSWESWRDRKIQPAKFDNIPTEGFVLNKKVGDGGGWRHARKAWFRTYDPRGFEFEISAANLVFILQECTSVKGKGLEGKFVYAWDRQQLVLLPVSSQEYQASKAHTQRQAMSIEPGDLVEGCIYRTKDDQELLYLGHHPFYYSSIKRTYNQAGNWYSGHTERTVQHKAKRHIFVDAKNPRAHWNLPGCWRTQIPFLVWKSQDLKKKLCERLTENPSDAYAAAFDKFANSKWGKKPEKAIA